MRLTRTGQDKSRLRHHNIRLGKYAQHRLISLRTREVLHARKLAGVKLGRPSGKGKSKLDEHSDDILRLVSLRVPKTIIAKQYGCSVGNLYNFLNRLGQCA